MLNVNSLSASIEGKTILDNFSIEIKPGEVHAIMGLNGSGKSTLANIIAGREEYEILGGEVIFNEKNLFDLSPEERAGEGLFLAFQYPVELAGVMTSYFLRTSYNSLRKYRNEQVASVKEFNSILDSKIKELKIDRSLLKRAVNFGFSGGEKKRLEMLQMLLADPRLLVMDETDSGLDIDALRTVANAVNTWKSSGSTKSILLITHYQRLLEHIKPDVVHVMINGKIVQSGGPELALTVEEKGYEWLEPSVKIAS
jgi:Fe-S cluster assembly ATP-binding protein